MSAYYRVHGGVVRPIGLADLANIRSKDLLMISDRSKPGTEYLQDGCACRELGDDSVSSSRAVTLRQLSAISLVIVHVLMCQHGTQITLDTHRVGLGEDARSVRSVVDEVVDAAKKIIAETSRAGSVQEFPRKFSQWMLEDLDVNLNEMLRGPYDAALSWQPGGSSDALHSQLQALLSARSALIDIEAITVSSVDDPLTLSTVRRASQKIEAALVGLTVWQTAILERSTQELASLASESAKRERAHDRRIADLGAVTLFPMLVFSFLGTNILPGVRFDFELMGIPVLIAAVIAGVTAAIVGRSWVRRTTSSEI